MQCDINREVTKILALSSGKIDKHEYLTGEEILPPDQRRVIEQAKFAYSPLGKTFEKQTERQVDAMKSPDPSNKLKQIKGIFPQYLMNDLICANLKEIVELQDIIKKDVLNYKSKREKTYNFSKYSLPIVFLRNIHERHLSIEKADDKQSNFTNELKNFDIGMKALEIKSFLNNLGLLFSAREKVPNSFKSRLFSIKNVDKITTREPAAETAAEKIPTKNQKSKLKLQQEFIKETIANEKDINDEIFWDYFKYQNQSFLAKDLIRATQPKNE